MTKKPIKKPTYYIVIYFGKDNNNPVGIAYTNDKTNFLKHTRIPSKQLDFIPIYRGDKKDSKHKKQGGL